MKKERREIYYTDDRGYIQDILTDSRFEHATYIFTKKNTVRGNHYHKKTVQYVFILDGKLEYHYLDKLNKHKKIILKKSDLVETPAFEKHAVKTLKDTHMIVLTRGPRGGSGYENDTFRLEKPLLKRT